MSFMSRISGIFAGRQTNDPKYPDERRIPIASRTLAGITITADNAITVPAVWACIRYLSQTVAVLPWHVMRTGDLGSDKASSHPLDALLYQRPNPEWSSFQFRETLMHWALRWGNGYAEIERDPVRGIPIALWPIHPTRVHPLRDEGGKLFYRVHNGTMEPTDLAMMDVFHVRGYGDGPVGINVCDYAAESIGWARAAQLFGAGFFGSGMNPAGVIEMTKSMSEPALKRMKAAFSRLYRGVRGERVMYLDSGMSFKPIGMELEKAQFIATNQYLVTEICRWFGVPPHKVADLTRGTFANVESQTIEVVVDSIAPWVKRFEDEANFKLFGANRNSYFTKMFMNALMRGDAAARAVYYQAMRQIGAMCVNDVRGLEDMNDLPAGAGGDKYTMQSQYTTLEQVGKVPPAPIGHNGGPPLDPAAEPTPGNTARAARADRVTLALLDTMELEDA